MEYKYRFSVFTATYNRCERLVELYKMLLSQSFTGGFEWVIVSDGSEDATSEYVRSFIKDDKIPITFIEKSNGGKHTAWRAATDVFQGRYIVTCDDDDLITRDMLFIFDRQWSLLENSPQYDQFWEIRSRVELEDGSLLGKELPSPYYDSDYNTVSYKMGIAAEMVGCRKVEILRKEAAVPDFFYFEGSCSNFPEGIRWSRAARKYKTRFIPDITRIYVIGHDSLCVTPRGSLRTAKKNYNSLVYALYSINEQSDLMVKYQIRKYIITILQLTYSAIRVRENVRHLIHNPINRFLYVALWCPIYIVVLSKSFIARLHA